MEKVGPNAKQKEKRHELRRSKGSISFGQDLNGKELKRAHDAALKADLVVAPGSTLSVHPAASFPLMAAERGAKYVIINRGESDQDGEACVSLRLDGDVGEIFPPAVDAALS